jgi:hypothetical protein
MKKSTIMLIAVLVITTIIFGRYLLLTNARNTTADIYLDNCLESSLALEGADIQDIFISCEMAVNLYRKHGSWDLLN